MKLCRRLFILILPNISNYSENLLIRCNSFSRNTYGALKSLADYLDIHCYLYIILLLENCGGLKGLADEVVLD